MGKASASVRDASPWAGRAFLGIGRALYLGPTWDTAPHAHHAIQLCCSLEGRLGIRFSDEGRWSQCESALIPAGRLHQLDGRGCASLLLYLEPETLLARRILATDPSDEIRALTRAQLARVRELARALPPSVDGIRAHQLYEQLLDSIGIRGRPSKPLDERVSFAIARMRGGSRQYDSLAALAREVGLSPSRFRHLFFEQMGISSRRYVLWQRLYRAIEVSASDGSVTHVAQTAGFSDAAHLARTFRRMLGITPSSLRGTVSLMHPPPIP